jgi:hypothetical protein
MLITAHLWLHTNACISNVYNNIVLSTLYRNDASITTHKPLTAILCYYIVMLLLKRLFEYEVLPKIQIFQSKPRRLIANAPVLCPKTYYIHLSINLSIHAKGSIYSHPRIPTSLVNYQISLARRIALRILPIK